MAQGTGLYIEGPFGSGKTQHLVQETYTLLQQHPTASVLILASNHSRQKAFLTRLNQLNLPAMAQPPVYTYAGYVRNTLFNFWPLVEAQIEKVISAGHPRVMPQLSGLEDSELILKTILQGFKHKHPETFIDFPGSQPSLLRQLIRRMRLRSENCLSRDEMTRRSGLLEEICQVETAAVEKQFDQLAYALRVLDPNKQLDVFHRLLETNVQVQQWFQSTIRHLVVDDVDETIPAQQNFIQWLSPHLETLILSSDVDGGSRRGYLNAYPYDWQALKALKPGETVQLSLPEKSLPLYQSAQTLLKNWKADDSRAFEPLGASVKIIDGFITRVEMLDRVAQDILRHLDQGGKPGDLAVVIPVADPLTVLFLKNRLSRRAVCLQVLSGTTRAIDDPLCRLMLYLLQLVNRRRWGIGLSSVEYRTIFTQLFSPILHQFEQDTEDNDLANPPMASLLPEAVDCLGAIVPEMINSMPVEQDTEVLPPLESLSIGLASQEALPPEIVAHYERLKDWAETVEPLPFEKQLYSAFHHMISPLASQTETFEPIKRLIDSYSRQYEIHQRLIETGLAPTLLPLSPTNNPENSEVVADFARLWMGLVKTGQVADTSESPAQQDSHAIILGTPQKIIDMEIHRQTQYWLDVSSREWSRSDNAPLYNAWVHSAVWDGSMTSFTEEFQEQVIRTRAAHITRTLLLLARQNIRAYASELDDLGFSQNGLLKDRLAPISTDTLTGIEIPQLTLREDQAPILHYCQGSLAVSAVPGAGKTYVNVALLLDLIRRGVPPENLLVLTYMDSAAKTMLSRLKKMLTGTGHGLPAISTIHSLAFRILTENDHALALGFRSEDMEILDEARVDDLLSEVAQRTQPESSRSPRGWQRAIKRGISHAKSLGLTQADLEADLRRRPQNFRLAEFLPAFSHYSFRMRQEGWLDFTDLVGFAIQLLSSNKEIREYYQSKYTYILEDEAQDSSRMLQRFIALLGGASPNLIRTGDTNQSITTTFSSADTAVFREFIAEADVSVTMNQSGRCAPPVMDLANGWIDYVSRQPVLAQSFQAVAMRPVPDQNPSLLTPIQAHFFDTQAEEETEIVSRIKAFTQAYPDCSVAVLLRQNDQVIHYSGLLQMAGVPAICMSDDLKVSPVFHVLLGWLRVLETPGILDVQVALYDALIKANLTHYDPDRREFLKTTLLFHNLSTAVNRNSNRQMDALGDEFLLQLYYDWLDFDRMLTSGNIPALLIHITDRCFQSVAHRSNGYLCALLVRDLIQQYLGPDVPSPLEMVVRQFEGLSRMSRGKRGFTQWAEAGLSGGHVKVMSLHKSKGQEFDAVFMPLLTERTFPHRLDLIRYDESDKLVQELDRIRIGGRLPENYRDSQKKAKLEEESRLIYVGFTRAKSALFLSSHAVGNNGFGRMEPMQPALAFEYAASHLQSSVMNVPVPASF
ncbi:MAG: UvrD-helicase domain-containing protein [Vampirovibrio sp.]|nr:UvrD-helicase domain-containing protein [Vampirovibrio sp.]